MPNQGNPYQTYEKKQKIQINETSDFAETRKMIRNRSKYHPGRPEARIGTSMNNQCSIEKLSNEIGRRKWR